MLLGYRPEKEESLSSTQSPLSFEQVCPTWARKLRIGLDEQDVRTLAIDSKYCIVGEAWGYNGRHAGFYIAPLIPLIGCWKCVKFGREMGKIAEVHGQSCTNDLQPVINHFLEHWNKKTKNSQSFLNIFDTQNSLYLRCLCSIAFPNKSNYNNGLPPFMILGLVCSLFYSCLLSASINMVA